GCCSLVDKTKIHRINITKFKISLLKSFVTITFTVDPGIINTESQILSIWLKVRYRFNIILFSKFLCNSYGITILKSISLSPGLIEPVLKLMFYRLQRLFLILNRIHVKSTSYICPGITYAGYINISALHTLMLHNR